MEIVTDNALGRLNELSRAAQSIQGAIAYWTFPPDHLDPSFARGVANAEGFLCCDLHFPTSIDSLERLKHLGGNLFLHLYQLVGKTEVADSKGMPNHLMHSKVLVFNTSEGGCTIWVGSHNATARSLTGINFECSLVFQTQRGSQQHADFMSHLDRIRRKSTSFELSDANYYRLLQGGMGTDGFIEVEDNTGDPLTPGLEISVFGSFESDHQQLTRVGKGLYLAVSESQTGGERIYRVSVVQSGKMNPKTRGSVTFDPRRYSMKAATRLPLLHRHQTVPADVYEKAVFFATLKIEEVLAGRIAVEAPPERLWEDVPASEYFENGIENDRVVMSDLGKSRGYKIQRAISNVPSTKRSSEDAIAWELAFQTLSLQDKRAMRSAPLIRRRLLVQSPDVLPEDENTNQDKYE